MPESTPALTDFIDAIETGVIIVDEAMVVRGWNRWMEQVTGRSAQAAAGLAFTDIFPDVRPAVREAIRDALDGKAVLMSQSLHRFAVPLPPAVGFEEFEQMQQTARFVPLQTRGAPMAAVFIQDVTERVARERQLREATDAAETANRAKSDFLAAMSHELRTPIGAMSGYADLILEGIYGTITDDQRLHLSRIKSVGQHLLGIVEEILLFARVEAGREEIRLEDVDAWSIAREALAIAEPIAKAKGLELTSSIPSAPSLIRTDPVKARQILVNLLGNAVKFTGKGRVSLTCSTAADGGVAFAVADTGPGIATPDIPRIFEPFTQLPNAYTRSQSGTGLGLPVSRRLAHMLGGDVTATSEVGNGSTFLMTLPKVAPT